MEISTSLKCYAGGTTTADMKGNQIKDVLPVLVMLGRHWDIARATRARRTEATRPKDFIVVVRENSL